jgi:hypothetical protein
VPAPCPRTGCAAVVCVAVRAGLRVVGSVRCVRALWVGATLAVLALGREVVLLQHLHRIEVVLQVVVVLVFFGVLGDVVHL